jgi:hypothetical protein
MFQRSAKLTERLSDWLIRATVCEWPTIGGRVWPIRHRALATLLCDTLDLVVARASIAGTDAGCAGSRRTRRHSP